MTRRTALNGLRACLPGSIYNFWKLELVTACLSTCLIGFHASAKKVENTMQCIQYVSNVYPILLEPKMLSVLCFSTKNVDTWCFVDSKMVPVPPPHGPTPTSLFSTKTCPFCLLFFVSHFCMQGSWLKKEPGNKALFCMITQHVKLLVHIMALQMVQICGPCLLSGQMYWKTLYAIKNIVDLK